jgi:hypothetical protein
VPAMSSFDYAVLRVVPRVEREEFLNAGVILFCLEQNFLSARIQDPRERLVCAWPNLDTELISAHLKAVRKICEGDGSAGPIARLSKRERFHWLVAPRSTVIQVSAVHTGLCEQPESKLENLFQQLVASL